MRIISPSVLPKMIPSVARLCDHTFLPWPLSRNSVVFDLGANRGLFAHGLIKRVGCRVFAAEPVSDLRATIARSDKLTLLPLALGGSNGRVRINVFEGRCASIVPSTDPDNRALRTEEVAVVTLAEFLTLTGADRVDLMKVDIEGAALDLFDAAAEDELRRIAQITVEFHDFIYPALRSRVENIKDKLLNPAYHSDICA